MGIGLDLQASHEAVEKSKRFWKLVGEIDPENVAKKYYGTILDMCQEENWESLLVDAKLEALSIKLRESQDPNFTGGRKFDGGKLQYGLLPPLALRETVRVLTFGAEKYEPDNWKRVPDPIRRYFDAAQRHLWAYKEGEVNDPESGVSHLAHALCCIMFMLDLDESDKVITNAEEL